MKNNVFVLEYEEDDLLSQAIIFFLAGYDSSATTMTLTLYELARHPDIQMKLRDEINNAIQYNNGEITYNMVFCFYLFVLYQNKHNLTHFLFFNCRI